VHIDILYVIPKINNAWQLGTFLIPIVVLLTVTF